MSKSVDKGSKSNVDHVVDVGASLSSMSKIAKSAASEGRKSLDATISSIDSAAGSSQGRTFFDVDVDSSKKAFADRVSSGISGQTDESDALVKRAARSVVSTMFGRKKKRSDERQSMRPEIDHVLVDVDRRRGTVDSFYARITFSLPASGVRDGSLRSARVMRATEIDAASMRRISSLSFAGVGLISSSPGFELRLSESKVDSSLSSVSIDPSTNMRTSSDESYDSSFDGLDLSNVDRSVSLDVNTQSRASSVVGRSISPDVVVSQGDSQKKSTLAFQEIATIIPDQTSAKIIGGWAQYSVDDQSIVYGRKYTYFVVVTDNDMRESQRSRIVEVLTDGLRIPARPSKIIASSTVDGRVALTISCEDMLVDKFEIYRMGSKEAVLKEIDIIYGPSGRTSDSTSRDPIGNGFIQVGETTFDASSGASSFYDVVPRIGSSYVYRAYSVDVFGNKSESPCEITTFVSDGQYATNDLARPTLIAEIDQTSKKVRLSFGCNDDRVKMLKLSRRDVSMYQHAFTVPHEPSQISLGNVDVYNSQYNIQQSAQGYLRFLGIRLNDVDRASGWSGWSGIFDSDGSMITFIDHATRFDHTYQYSVYGIDRFGNETHHIYSNPVFVSRRPVLSTPVNFFASIGSYDDGSISGVSLSWNDANVNFTTDDLVGSQAELGDSSVRSLFQLQRKSSDEEIWRDFPLSQETSSFDPVSYGDVAEPFRPPLLEVGKQYSYRVQSFQTGSFVSNFSDVVDVIVEKPILPVTSFRARPSDAKVRPLYVMLTWDPADPSTFVDHWKISRAVINVFASKNVADVSKLSFAEFRTVMKESSRFRSRSIDDALEDTQCGFMDMDVRIGNTYYYMIEAVSKGGSVSSASYAASSLSDEVYSSKISQLIGEERVSSLSNQLVPLIIVGDPLEPQQYSSERSYGIVPSFSNPSTTVDPRFMP